MTSQANRIQKYIREHPGCTTLDLLRGLDPPCTNPRARISDLRKQLEPQGLTVIGVKRKDGVMTYHLRPIEPMTLGLAS